jgi:hypothetical protein
MLLLLYSSVASLLITAAVPESIYKYLLRATIHTLVEVPKEDLLLESLVHLPKWLHKTGTSMSRKSMSLSRI